MPNQYAGRVSDAELGKRERARRRCVIGTRLPKDVVDMIEVRAEKQGVSRSRVVRALVLAALAAEGKA
jgi:hypothetical protein